MNENKKVWMECINNEDYTDCVTIGKHYLVEIDQEHFANDIYKIIDDKGNLFQTIVEMFKKLDLPESIIPLNTIVKINNKAEGNRYPYDKTKGDYIYGFIAGDDQERCMDEQGNLSALNYYVIPNQKTWNDNVMALWSDIEVVGIEKEEILIPERIIPNGTIVKVHYESPNNSKLYYGTVYSNDGDPDLTALNYYIIPNGKTEKDAEFEHWGIVEVVKFKGENESYEIKLLQPRIILEKGTRVKINNKSIPGLFEKLDKSQGDYIYGRISTNNMIYTYNKDGNLSGLSYIVIQEETNNVLLIRWSGLESCEETEESIKLNIEYQKCKPTFLNVLNK